MTPESFTSLAGRGLPGFDGAFLGFRRGRMGNQALLEELAPLFSNHYFLYDMEITGTALRCCGAAAGRTRNEVISTS
jgi:hypothetical protein